MLSERKYRVDKYIEMARLTASLDKKEELLDMARFYLECDEFDVTKENISRFFDVTEKEDIIGIHRNEVYERYIEFCKENGEVIQSKPSFYRQIEKKYKLVVKKIRQNEDRIYCYVEN